MSVDIQLYQENFFNEKGSTNYPEEKQPQNTESQKNIQTLNALTLTIKIHSSPMYQQMSLKSCIYSPYLPGSRTFLPRWRDLMYNGT